MPRCGRCWCSTLKHIALYALMVHWGDAKRDMDMAV